MPERVTKLRPMLPRRMWRYPVNGTAVEQLRKLSPRQRWIAEQSTLRYERRFGDKVTVMQGEIGTFDGIVIVQSRSTGPCRSGGNET